MEFSSIDSLNVYFFLWAAILIFFMKAGFILLEVGQIRQKNVGTHMTLKFLDLATVLILYFFVGYGVAYGFQYIGGGLIPAGTEPGSFAHFMKMVMFAVAAVTIVSGAVAERIKISGYMIGAIVIGTLIYPIYEGLAWGSFMGGFLGDLGYHDFAGAGVVHLMGGTLGIMAAWVLGPRLGRYDENGKPVPIPGHNVTFVVIGAFILAFGWFGFNIGSASFIGPDGANIASVAVITALSMAAAILTSALITKGDPIWCSNGMCAGLVAICAGADLFTPVSALIVGGVAGLIIPYVFKFVEEKGIDDTCGVTPVHAVSGLWGVLAAGLFIPSVSLTSQLIGSIVVIVLAVAGGLTIYGALKVLGLLRIDQEMEIIGLDESLYEMNVYPESIVERIDPS